MFDTEKFIVEVQKRPAIYEEQNGRKAKMDAWDEVCQAMVQNWKSLTNEERDTEERHLRKKWRKIKDHFMKELKLQKSQEADRAARKRKKYAYFDQLHFLLPTVETKRNVQMKKTSPDHSDRDSEMDNSAIQPRTSKEYHNVPTPSGQPEMRCRYSPRMCETSLDSFANNIQHISTPRSQAMIEDMDYDRMFLLSLLPMMKQVPDIRKLDVRMKMEQILAAALYASEP